MQTRFERECSNERMQANNAIHSMALDLRNCRKLSRVSVPTLPPMDEPLSSYRRISSLRRRISMAVTGSFLFNPLAKVIGGAFGGLLSNTLRASRTFASTSDGQ